ncbi:facilitated trehalose transporter Tret1-like [Homalodisca vitripennis]|uniref:facilitated trehalose transporter Tret1-like n=1 Tax=Homalodisca vitripennis TaxID=197043 RepID=UPI001EEAE5A0|nr:facilitated trehalose transporter Tret1-like [Homalodisca vitripennis]
MTMDSRTQYLSVFRQYLAAITVALSMLTIGMSSAWPSPVLPKILNHTSPVTMDITEISWMVSLYFLGNTLSPIPAGWLMDKFGRKRIMYIFNVLPFSAWVITYFAKSAWPLYLARFLNGLWAGTAYTICAIYIGEIAEPSIRGSLSNFNNLLKNAGGLCVFVVGPYISFELLAILCGLVPTVFFFAALLIPESPYFLLMINKNKEAKEALRWLRGNKEESLLELELTNIHKAVLAQTEITGRFKDIFTDRANRKGFLIVMILSIVKNMSGFDVMQAYTSITLPVEAFDSIGPNECVIILGVISLVTSVLSIFLLDRFPRRFLLTVSSLGCGAMTLLAGCWFFLNEKTDINVRDFAQLPFYSFIFHAVVYSIGLGPIVASVKGEMFFSKH